MAEIPEVPLQSGSTKAMPLIALGTALYPYDPEATRQAVVRAIELGFRHFDTAALYQSERPLGQAIADALSSGLIQSRDELFITSKLWCSDAHSGRVLPALRNTLENLQLEYLDLYLIHWPVSMIPGKIELPINNENLMPLDMRVVWEEMEECQRLGLTKYIGVSNFSCKKLETLLSHAKIPPAANQVEVNPLWQQKRLREFCVANGIQICAYSPLGAKGTIWGKKWVMECDVLKEIAEAKGKTIAQICLRWVYEQGDCVVVKSFNEKRMRENLDIFDWELTEDERHKISKIEQHKSIHGTELISNSGPYKTLEELWDNNI